MEGRQSEAGLECLGVFLDTLQLLTGARDRHRIPVEPSPPPPEKGAAATAPPSANPKAPSPQPDGAAGPASPLPMHAAATASAAEAGQAKDPKPLARTGQQQQQGAEAGEEAAADLQWRVAVRELLPRVLHLCYGPGWATRLGGVAAMELLTDK